MMLTILATNPNPDLYGVSRMLLESVAGFRDADWRVVVSIPDHGPLVEAVEALGAESHPCPTPVLRKGDLNPVGLVRLLWRTMRSIPPGMRLLRSLRPDVVYVSTIIEPLWVVLARACGVPVVCHVHEGESTASPLLRRALALPLLLASRLIVNSRFSLGVLTDSIPRLERRCTVVYNGIVGPPDVTAPRADLVAPVRLLFIGRLSERKGVQDAVAAVAELDRRGVRAELDVVGSAFPGYEWVEHDLRARGAALPNRVRLHGFDPDVWSHLAGCDILLVPSRVDEPFGNTAVEGVLAARPVVATGTSGLLEATEGIGATKLVPPSDPAALAEAVVDLVERWTEVRAMVVEDATEAARRYAPSRYRAEVVDQVARTHT